MFLEKIEITNHSDLKKEIKLIESKIKLIIIDDRVYSFSLILKIFYRFLCSFYFSNSKKYIIFLKIAKKTINQIIDGQELKIDKLAI